MKKSKAEKKTAEKKVAEMQCTENEVTVTYSDGEKRSISMSDNPCAATAIELFAQIL